MQLDPLVNQLGSYRGAGVAVPERRIGADVAGRAERDPLLVGAVLEQLAAATAVGQFELVVALWEDGGDLHA